MRRFISASDISKKRRLRKSKRLNIMIIIMFMAFIVSWSPYAIICFVKLIDSTMIPPTATVLPLLFAKRLQPSSLLMTNHRFIKINLFLPKYCLDWIGNIGYFV